MTRLCSALFAAVVLCLMTVSLPATGPAAGVTVKNLIPLARASETVVLSAPELQRLMAVDDVRKVHVLDEVTKKELVAQAVDTNDDGVFEQFLFQTDIGPRETRTFTLTSGGLQVHAIADYKAYGRFVRERRDDYAWENDRVAHRMYGAALETWEREPLTSSAVDVWAKRVRRLVINDWYMVDDYHADNGTGGDFYSAGKSRGCGGNGLWVDGKLYPSANFRDSRTLASGPIRVMFELKYQAWDGGGTRVSEVKRITLDAGQNLNRFESLYTVVSGKAAVTHAVGIKKNPTSVATSSKDLGLMRTWEAFKGEAGNLGCGVIVEPSQVVEFAEADGNFLAVAKVPAGGPATYHAGFGWDKSGDFKGVEDWDRYLQQAVQRLRSPLEIAVALR
jgi:hypothetical protein